MEEDRANLSVHFMEYLPKLVEKVCAYWNHYACSYLWFVHVIRNGVVSLSVVWLSYLDDFHTFQQLFHVISLFYIVVQSWRLEDQRIAYTPSIFRIGIVRRETTDQGRDNETLLQQASWENVSLILNEAFFDSLWWFLIITTHEVAKVFSFMKTFEQDVAIIIQPSYARTLDSDL